MNFTGSGNQSVRITVTGTVLRYLVKVGLVQASEGGPFINSSQLQSGFQPPWLFLLKTEGSPGNVGACSNKCWLTPPHCILPPRG